MTGGASVVAFIGLALIVIMIIIKKQLKGKVYAYADKERELENLAVLNFGYFIIAMYWRFLFWGICSHLSLSMLRIKQNGGF